MELNASHELKRALLSGRVTGIRKLEYGGVALSTSDDNIQPRISLDITFSCAFITSLIGMNGMSPALDLVTDGTIDAA